MRKLLLAMLVTVLSSVAFGQGHHKVSGYYRSNGTYVKSHYRTNPNHTVSDNWSTKPNVNPYTGKVGTKTYNNSSSYNYTPKKNYNYTPKTNYNYTPKTYNSYTPRPSYPTINY